ncbi:MAG TPA: type 1 glutamine amidotransferase domain-containing protein [Pseudogracilibacillus sp.]|nr:type 1 glutamine amidotransferase domain-containing protein [Pseudogracilibacillus sp.]
MRLKGKKIVAVVEDLYNDLEHWYPVYRMREEGAEVIIAGPEANKTYNGQSGIPAQTDVAFSDIDAKDYDGILIPGGWAPDRLRRYPELLEFVRKMNDAKKPIGQICHAGWVLVSANILKGKKVTSTPAIKDDMRNAGADWVNEECVVDGNIVSSRRPDDMPVYAKAFADLVAEQ